VARWPGEGPSRSLYIDQSQSAKLWPLLLNEVQPDVCTTICWGDKMRGDRLNRGCESWPIKASRPRCPTTYIILETLFADRGPNKPCGWQYANKNQPVSRPCSCYLER
jgi:hypothetical protein